MGTADDSRIRSARKRHACAGCGAAIEVGSRYLDLAVGLKRRERYCLACAPDRVGGYAGLLRDVAFERGESCPGCGAGSAAACACSAFGGGGGRLSLVEPSDRVFRRSAPTGNPGTW